MRMGLFVRVAVRISRCFGRVIIIRLQFIERFARIALVSSGRPQFGMVKLAWVLVVAAVGEMPAFSAVTITNGDFSLTNLSGTGWITQGSVFAPAGVASLGDDTTTRTFLYQVVPVSGGTYSLSFDVNPSLSPNIAPGNFLDSFFSSVYFTDTPGAFDLIGNTGFSGVQQVADLDASGIVSLGSGVTFAPAPGEPGFTRYTVILSTPASYLVPVFELFDLNGITADSLVRLDNVAGANSVPEPNRTLLFAAGCAAAILARRRASPHV